MIKYLLIFSMVVFYACGEDECTQADWEGIYRGVKSVDGEPQDNYLFEITLYSFPITNPPSETQLEFTRYELDGIWITVDGCEIIGGNSITIATTNYSGSLDGDKFNLVIEQAGRKTTYVATKE